jgi:FHS family L-fucose permease-like MFS transporter
MAPNETGSRPLFPAGNLFPFFLVTALFFLWGIPNNLNDVLIKQFMKSFEISRLEAGLVQFAFYLGYFFLAIPAGLLMRKFGYKAAFLTGLVLFGAGCLLFWPAALVGRYSFFLAALFVIASGLSFLETSSSPFIAQCGDPETSERRLNFSQTFNPLGAITGALVGTVFIFSGVELNPAQVGALQAAHTYGAYLQIEKLRVIRPYVVLGLVVLVWAILIARTKFPAIADEAESGNRDSGNVRELFRHRHFILAVVAQFLYVGAQVATWSYFIIYAQDYTHEPEKIAGYLLTGNLVALLAGRAFSTYLMKFINPARLMGVYAVINVALVCIGVFLPGWTGLWALLMTSFFMSLMFPTIFALGLKGLGANTKMGGSLIVMAIVGGALYPLGIGFLSEKLQSLALAYGLLLPAYVFIAYYAFLGSKVRLTGQDWERAETAGPGGGV